MKKVWIIAALVFLLDQLSKVVMTYYLDLGESVPVFSHFFHLTLVYNTGGAFGLLANQTWVFVVLSVFTIIFLLYFYKQYALKTTALYLPIGFVLGGALGNLLDRVRLGYVVDYLDFFIGSLHWPAFNVADSSICIGLGLLALKLGVKE